MIDINNIDASLYVDGFSEGYTQGSIDAVRNIRHQLDILNASDMSSANLYRFACSIKTIVDRITIPNDIEWSDNPYQE